MKPLGMKMINKRSKDVPLPSLFSSGDMLRQFDQNPAEDQWKVLSLDKVCSRMNYLSTC